MRPLLRSISSVCCAPRGSWTALELLCTGVRMSAMVRCVFPSFVYSEKAPAGLKYMYLLTKSTLVLLLPPPEVLRLLNHLNVTLARGQPCLLGIHALSNAAARPAPFGSLTNIEDVAAGEAV